MVDLRELREHGGDPSVDVAPECVRDHGRRHLGQDVRAQEDVARAALREPEESPLLQTGEARAGVCDADGGEEPRVHGAREDRDVLAELFLRERERVQATLRGGVHGGGQTSGRARAPRADPSGLGELLDEERVSARVAADTADFFPAGRLAQERHQEILSPAGREAAELELL